MVTEPSSMHINNLLWLTNAIWGYHKKSLLSLQGKMPLHLLSEVIQSIVIMAEYFEDVSQYSWVLLSSI